MTDRETLLQLLLPFIREGRKWVGTHPAHDDLTLLCGEDWPHMTRRVREAAFTVGDLKRAAALWQEAYDLHHTQVYPQLCHDAKGVVACVDCAPSVKQ